MNAGVQHEYPSYSFTESVAWLAGSICGFLFGSVCILSVVSLVLSGITLVVCWITVARAGVAGFLDAPIGFKDRPLEGWPAVADSLLLPALVVCGVSSLVFYLVSRSGKKDPLPASTPIAETPMNKAPSREGMAGAGMAGLYAGTTAGSMAVTIVLFVAAIWGVVWGMHKMLR